MLDSIASVFSGFDVTRPIDTLFVLPVRVRFLLMGTVSLLFTLLAVYTPNAFVCWMLSFGGLVAGLGSDWARVFVGLPFGSQARSFETMLQNELSRRDNSSDAAWEASPFSTPARGTPFSDRSPSPGLPFGNRLHLHVPVGGHSASSSPVSSPTSSVASSAPAPRTATTQPFVPPVNRRVNRHKNIISFWCWAHFFWVLVWSWAWQPALELEGFQLSKVGSLQLHVRAPWNCWVWTPEKEQTPVSLTRIAIDDRAEAPVLTHIGGKYLVFRLDGIRETEPVRLELACRGMPWTLSGWWIYDSKSGMRKLIPPSRASGLPIFDTLGSLSHGCETALCFAFVMLHWWYTLVTYHYGNILAVLAVSVLLGPSKEMLFRALRNAKDYRSSAVRRRRSSVRFNTVPIVASASGSRASRQFISKVFERTSSFLSFHFKRYLARNSDFECWMKLEFRFMASNDAVVYNAEIEMREVRAPARTTCKWQVPRAIVEILRLAKERRASMPAGPVVVVGGSRAARPVSLPPSRSGIASSSSKIFSSIGSIQHASIQQATPLTRAFGSPSLSVTTVPITRIIPPTPVTPVRPFLSRQATETKSSPATDSRAFDSQKELSLEQLGGSSPELDFLALEKHSDSPSKRDSGYTASNSPPSSPRALHSSEFSTPVRPIVHIFGSTVSSGSARNRLSDRADRWYTASSASSDSERDDGEDTDVGGYMTAGSRVSTTKGKGKHLFGVGGNATDEDGYMTAASRVGAIMSRVRKAKSLTMLPGAEMAPVVKRKVQSVVFGENLRKMLEGYMGDDDSMESDDES
ncbi:hypothetical protein BJ742DRAFT_80250 [Cladochytrium replicatum]|nr:hypothetical protein BJ742DRAFT_80250 [Cladochytrium replicatum]